MMDRRRIIAALAISTAYGLCVGPATAQLVPEEGPTARESRPEAQPGLPESPPPDASDEARAEHLDALFEQLARPDNPLWERVQTQILEAWRRSGSASMDLLLARAGEAIEARAYRTALLHLDDLVRLAPDFAEGWNQRATVYFLIEDYARSVRDISRVLALEPRHFGALAGLGIILDRTGNAAGALEAYRRAHALHPNLPGARLGIEKLAPDVDGREL